MTDRPAPALLAAVAMTLLLGGCGTAARPAASGAAAKPSAAPTIAATSAADTRAVATPIPYPDAYPSPIATTPDAVAAIVRSAVTAGNPRLLPAYLPPGMSASVTASPATYLVDYEDDLHTRHIHLSAEAFENPPPILGDGTQTYVRFRGERALYAVYDRTSAKSLRYLLWGEPGSWSPMGHGSPVSAVEYYLGAEGLTNAEFFRVAGSLQPTS
jgi:hypothetical protein